jgi:prolyl oligopeptidase
VELGFQPFTFHDGKYVFLIVYHGTDPKNGIYFRTEDSTEPFIHLVEHTVASFNPIETIGSTMYVRTDLDAPRGRVIAIDLNNPAKENWKEVIPQKTEVIDGVSLVNGELVVNYMRDAHNALMLYKLDGTLDREIPLPAIGTVDGVSGRPEDKEFFYAFTSFTYPTSSFRYDFTTGKSDVFHAPKVEFDPSQYETKQVFYRVEGWHQDSDVHHRQEGAQARWQESTLLYGYGGFNIAMTPSFSASRVVWLENGGVYALACLRGGSEYGEDWHEAGTLERKQNVFDDFIAAGEYLIRRSTRRRRCLSSRAAPTAGCSRRLSPPSAPTSSGRCSARCRSSTCCATTSSRSASTGFRIMEMRKESAKDFAFLYKYSPLHNVKPGVKYPPMLITTADHDDRVFPAHAEKFAATLQANDGGDNPILIRIETRAGHGGGKPVSKQIEEQADLYSFVYKTIGFKPETVWANLKEKQHKG